MGGRSILWGRQSYRLSDLDFEANAKDGIAVDWPIRYKDLASCIVMLRNLPVSVDQSKDWHICQMVNFYLRWILIAWRKMWPIE
jgi:hypothetical protein